MGPLTQIIRLTIFILFVGCTASLAQSSSAGPQNEVQFRGDLRYLSGDANFSGNNDSGSTISFGADFNLDRSVGYDLRYVRRSKNDRHKFVAHFSSSDWGRSASLSRNFTFLGHTYVAHLEIDLDVSLKTFGGSYAYRWGNKKVRFGPKVDAGLVNVGVKLTGTTTSGSATAKGTIRKPVATAGYEFEANPSSKVSIFHELGGIVFQGQHVLSVEGGIKFSPFRYFGIMGGYTYQRYKLMKDDSLVVIRQQGPFAGIAIRF